MLYIILYMIKQFKYCYNINNKNIIDTNKFFIYLFIYLIFEIVINNLCFLV